jgi:hypothetical protein
MLIAGSFTALACWGTTPEPTNMDHNSKLMDKLAKHKVQNFLSEERCH